MIDKNARGARVRVSGKSPTLLPGSRVAMPTQRHRTFMRALSNRIRLVALAAGSVVAIAILLPSPREHLHSEIGRFYAPDSFWNIPIGPDAVTDPNSSAEVAASFTPFASRAGFSNGAYGIPLAYASPEDKVYAIACTGDPEECNGRKVFQFPIPSGARPASGSDHHLSVIYPEEDGSEYAGRELDMWDVHYDRWADRWSATAINVLRLYGPGVCEPTARQLAEGKHCQSSVAAGVAALGGAVRPEEIARGHIDHALAIATPAPLAGYIACPATHTDGRHHAPAVPEGARVQLDPSIDVEAQDWPRWIKIIAVALQRYGGIVVDYSDVLVIKGISDHNPGVRSWASVGVPVDEYNNLSLLPWHRLRVLRTRDCR